MKTWIKVFAVTMLVAAPAMMLGPVIWPPPTSAPSLPRDSFLLPSSSP